MVLGLLAPIASVDPGVRQAGCSAANLLVCLVMWLVPTPLIAGMVNKY